MAISIRTAGTTRKLIQPQTWWILGWTWMNDSLAAQGCFCWGLVPWRNCRQWMMVQNFRPHATSRYPCLMWRPVVEEMFPRCILSPMVIISDTHFIPFPLTLMDRLLLTCFYSCTLKLTWGTWKTFQLQRRKIPTSLNAASLGVSTPSFPAKPDLSI